MMNENNLKIESLQNDKWILYNEKNTINSK